MLNIPIGLVTDDLVWKLVSQNILFFNDIIRAVIREFEYEVLKSEFNIKNTSLFVISAIGVSVVLVIMSCVHTMLILLLKSFCVLQKLKWIFFFFHYSHLICPSITAPYIMVVDFPVVVFVILEVFFYSFRLGYSIK